MKFKVGQKVRVREDLEEGKEYGNERVSNGMLKYRGEIVTINQAFDKTERYFIRQDCNYFAWSEEMLEQAEYTYEDLCNAPIGTKITFENEEVFTKIGKNKDLWENDSSVRDNKELENLKDNYGNFGKIIKIEEPTYTTVYEEDILDEKEKDWLSVVIKSFKNKIIYIKKESYCDNSYEFLTIKYKDRKSGEYKLLFPDFKKGTMYKGMEVDKGYTLEELGL